VFFPDGRHFLFYNRIRQSENQAGVYVGSLDSLTTTRVLPSGSMALYGSGRLLFVQNGTLFAQAFDDRTLHTTGEPVRIGDHVGYFSEALGYFAATVSSNGVLVYGPGNIGLLTELRWVDRTGAASGRPAAPPAFYSSPRLSPDQTSVAIALSDATTPERDIWRMNVERGTTTRETFDPAAEWFPAWGSDNRTLFFGSTRLGLTSVFRKVGAGQDELYFADPDRHAVYPNDTSLDGRFLLYTESSSRGYDLSVLPLSGERKPSTFLATPFNETQGRFSPDSRWIAYASDQSGRFEVYVRPFPDGTDEWRVSIAGGTQPEWRRDGKELFYIAADRKLMAVPVTTDAHAFSFGNAQALFDVEMPDVVAPYTSEYAVRADGQQFLVNTVVEQKMPPTLTAVLNWTADLGK